MKSGQTRRKGNDHEWAVAARSDRGLRFEGPHVIVKVNLRHFGAHCWAAAAEGNYRR